MDEQPQRRGRIKKCAALVAEIGINADPAALLRTYFANAKELNDKIAFQMSADPDTKSIYTRYAISLDVIMEAEKMKGNPTHPDVPEKLLRKVNEKLKDKDCFATLSPYDSLGPQVIILNQVIQNEATIHEMHQIIRDHRAKSAL